MSKGKEKMKKFGQILALAFMLAFGYGLGQHTQDLFATDYPGGGTHPVNLASDVTGELPHASTSNDSADVHGLDSGANVLGNLDASAEFIQRGQTSNFNTSVNAVIDQLGTASVTFGTAFSATPFLAAGGNTGAEVIQTGTGGLGTTGFTALGSRTTDVTVNVQWIAVGS